ncbi:MAG TPA: undecaprenyl-diphosphatase UppP [Nitrospirota bacterium]
MFLFEALVLGIVQGLTEFLPVSSTAHLILFPWALGWDSPMLNSLTFDVALHLGTLVAVLYYFRKDWIRLVGAFFTSIKNRRISGADERTAWLLIAACLPAGVLGIMFEDYVETTLRSPLIIVVTLVGVSLLMVAAERAAKMRAMSLPVGEMTLTHALVIGFAQASALIPGVSRSGATITAGLWSGYSRADAARFSFLLSTPVIAGACALKLGHLVNGMPEGEAAAFAAGAVASGLSGYAAIAFLIRYLAKRPLYVFAAYRVVLAAGILCVYFFRS